MNLRRFFNRDESDDEQRKELESYLEITTDDYIAQGMDPRAAREAARRKLGNPTRIREEIYTMNNFELFDALARQTRFTLRSWRQNPTFAVIAILTLAIGIGANTAVFSVINSILLKPLPYPNADQLVELHQEAPGAGSLTSGGAGLPLSKSMYFTYAQQNQSFNAMGIWTSMSSVVTGLAEPEQVRVIGVSDGTLEALQVNPQLGRLFSPNDQVPGETDTVLLSHSYWQSHFGSDPTVTTRKIVLGGRPRNIIGVMPTNFRIADATADIFMPLQLDLKRQFLAGFGFQSIGRLKPGITIAQANADITRLIPIWMRSWPSIIGGAGDAQAAKVYTDWRITPALRPLHATVVGNIGGALWIVMGTLAMVMLIACANVANLLLVRVEGRQQELALRSALGAGSTRIIGELLLESALLSLTGAALGIAFAYWGLALLVQIGPANLPRLSEISLDTQALLFAITIAALSALFFGLIPALKYAGPKISLALRTGSRIAGPGRDRHRARNLLVVAQVALALVLLISSGLMIRTFEELRLVEPGFTSPDQIETLRLLIPSVLVPEAERVARMENEITRKLAAIPGVTAVGFSSGLPMDQSLTNWDGILKEGQTYSAGERPAMRTFINISPGYFNAQGTRILAGADVSWNDIFKLRPVVMVSENLAKELWGSATNAIGKRVRPTDLSPWFEVVGVAQDVHIVSAQEAAPATVYWPAMGPSPFPQSPPNITRAAAFSIRSNRAGTQAFLEQIRQAVWSVNPNLPVAEMQTMQDIAGHSMARTSFTLVMLAIAGSMALILGVIGIYGVISYTVAQRRREVGIRMALGAQRGTVQRMFVGQGLGLCTIGILIGLVLAAILSQMMSSVLFGVAPLDPITYIATAALLFLAATAACYLPARRAAAVDPAETLRSE